MELACSWALKTLPSINIITIAAFASIIIIFSITLLTRKRSQPPRKQPPPSPPSWPIIGHLHLLSNLPHLSLYHLSRKYGPIIFIRFGSATAVVASSAAMAREFLLTNDANFPDRPYFEIGKRVVYDGGSLALMDYGPRWRELRKMYTHQILTAKRIEMFKHVRTEEISLGLKEIKQQSERLGDSSSIHVSKVLYEILGNVMSRTLLSKRCFRSDSEDMEFKSMISEIAVLFVTPLIGDTIPYLKWVDSLRGYPRQMDNLQKRLDAYLQQFINDRQFERQKYASETPKDFLDLLLDGGKEIDMTSIKSIILDLLGGGTETSSTTVEWAMSELLRSPSTVKKLQNELDTIVGPHRNVDESDLPKLDYLHAVIKETFRLHPPLPLLIPHQSRQACEVAGYLLPEKTRLLVNVWAIGRDPTVWERAEEFWPERFLGSSIDVKGQHYELLPFGAGRRGCPGVNFGLLMVGLLLSNLVHSFDWSLPAGESPQTLDMEEKSAITANRRKPLLAVPKPRLAD